ncbi:CBS domain-containing protein [Actinokineospora globicatena]|uniref:CBS domain-containing protein n=1 Tax=Actinokineospora globicatena TaxID=103729 RepID=UPI0020A2A2D7|nr:CBS domain-containing protein [Actinokineospora globicatena]MCP2304579.1 CBS domain-containing protein [Actinokineospora globicatena]GLW78052.1 CBS domain-containing protein [Actinokineospora globicatena]GLW85282.1 CBS domain-containing protein [Actinokineospora globicatena]
MRARDVMSSPVVTATPATAVKDAAGLLASHGFTTLPVVSEDGKLVGVVTEADIVRDRFPRDARFRHLHTADAPPPNIVADVMTSPATSVDAGTDVVDLVSTMLDDGIRALPVVHGDELLGIITRGDLVRLLTRDDEVLATDLRHRLELYGDPTRWTVTVHNGTATITDELNDPTDHHVAEVLATSIPGITSAHVNHRRDH